MQNQPGSGPNKDDPAETRHDRQAASLREDAFRGGNLASRPFRLSWLKSPWKPAVSRLFGNRPKTDE